MINRYPGTDMNIETSTALEQLSFPAILAMRAERTPDLIAFRFLPTGTSKNVATLTYSELQARANAVAFRVVHQM
jgi:acyl-CoA synthetase (AMP-forming)/AMP-acid ligase II